MAGLWNYVEGCITFRLFHKEVHFLRAFPQSSKREEL